MLQLLLIMSEVFKNSCAIIKVKQKLSFPWELRGVYRNVQDAMEVKNRLVQQNDKILEFESIRVTIAKDGIHKLNITFFS
mgnify:CR=1 FL=1